jgi:hypothetical protein
MTLQVPDGATITKAWFMVKRNKHDDDVDAKLSKTITSSASAGVGQITDTGADGTGAVYFQIRPADYDVDMTPTTTYYYAIKVLYGTDDPDTVETGTVQFGAGVVQAVS